LRGALQKCTYLCWQHSSRERGHGKCHRSLRYVCRTTGYSWHCGHHVLKDIQGKVRRLKNYAQKERKLHNFVSPSFLVVQLVDSHKLQINEIEWSGKYKMYIYFVALHKIVKCSISYRLCQMVTVTSFTASGGSTYPGSSMMYGVRGGLNSA
jgi:hypothetical protein